MFLKKILGILSLKIISANPIKLLNILLKENITLLNANIDGYELKVQIFFTDYFKVKKILKSKDEKIEDIRDKGGVISFFFRYRLRYGIAVGFVVSLLTCIFLSNILLEVKVYGADDQTKAQVLNVLERDGVTTGTFLPTLNRLALECDIVNNTTLVALADTRTEGCTLCIDIKMIDEKKKTQLTQSKEIYADIISDKDAIITKMEIFAGEKLKIVGEEVKKGEKIVSGAMTLHGKLLPIEEKAFFYSNGKVYGDYDETISFFVPYKDIEQSVEENITSSLYFQFFSAQIPFNPFSDNSGLKETEKVSRFSLFGNKLPFGITTKTYDKYSYRSIIRSEKEAMDTCKKRIENYEKNILKDKTIITKSEKTNKTKDGVTITVSYRLNGEIGKIKEIFKK